MTASAIARKTFEHQERQSGFAPILRRVEAKLTKHRRRRAGGATACPQCCSHRRRSSNCRSGDRSRDEACKGPRRAQRGRQTKPVGVYLSLAISVSARVGKRKQTERSLDQAIARLSRGCLGLRNIAPVGSRRRRRRENTRRMDGFLVMSRRSGVWPTNVAVASAAPLAVDSF